MLIVSFLKLPIQSQVKLWSKGRLGKHSEKRIIHRSLFNHELVLLNYCIVNIRLLCRQYSTIVSSILDYCVVNTRILCCQYSTTVLSILDYCVIDTHHCTHFSRLWCNETGLESEFDRLLKPQTVWFAFQQRGDFPLQRKAESIPGRSLTVVHLKIVFNHYITLNVPITKLPVTATNRQAYKRW